MFPRRRDSDVVAEGDSHTRWFRESGLHDPKWNGRRARAIHEPRGSRFLPASGNAHAIRAPSSVRQGSSIFPIVLLPCKKCHRR